jgi:hypothetical protein
MGAFLYVNSLGKEITRFSYSAGSDFNYCPQKFYLKRRLGWREKIRRAAMLYGIAIENAVRYYHENEFRGGVKRFADEWEKHKDDAGITYSAKDKSWENLLQCGKEHMALYDILLPTFPILRSHKPKFQIPFTKEIFPGTELAGIELIAYVDMVAKMGNAQFNEPVLVDIKASAKRLTTVPGIIGLDQQLRTYSYVSDIRGVAFLWFARNGRDIERGSNVRLLVDITNNGMLLKAGTEAVVGDVIEPDWGTSKDAKGKEKKNSAPDDYDGSKDKLILVANDTVYDGVKTSFPGTKKEEKEARAKAMLGYAIGIVNPCDVTRQEIQFVSTVISDRDREEAGTGVQYDIAKIVNASKQDYWPKLGGVRYPNDRCTNCECRALCLKDDKLRDETLVRTDEDWDTPTEGEVE